MAVKTTIAMETGVSVGGYELVRDPEIPAARLLRQPKQLGKVFSSLLANSFGGNLHVRIRRYLPGKRCVAAVDVTPARAGNGASERRRFIIKLYAPGKGAAAFATLQNLRSHGLSSGRFAVCRPIAYDPTWHLLILERAHGESLGSRLLMGKNAEQYADGAARWLHALHNCGLTEGRRYDFGRHLHTLGLQGRHLAEVFPERGRQYRGVLQRIEKQGWPLSRWTPAPTHRDFTPEHLYWDDDQLTGLDFDEFCQYDPLFDVGHFMAHLRLMSLCHPGAAPGLNHVAQRFQAAYEAGAENYSLSRVRLYQAMTYLKLAYVVGVVERPGNWRGLVTALVHEADQLAGEDVT